MKLLRKIIFLVMVSLLVLPAATSKLLAQCSVCTRTAQQMGERPAKALNTGILYLAAAPLMIAGFIGYRWWKNEPNASNNS